MYQKGYVFLVCSDCSHCSYECCTWYQEFTLDYMHTKEGIVSIGIDSVTLSQNGYLHYVHIAGQFNFVY